MLRPKIQEALNAHVTEELFSANLYLAMAAWAEAKAFKGFGRWLRVQHEEELGHARKLLDHLLDRGGTASLGAVPAPGSDFGSTLQLFERVLEHERHVTASLEDFYALAAAEHDAATQVFLQWFVTEQVEEERSAQEIVDRLRLVADRPGSVLYLDKEYGKRGKPAG
ncbi:MAG TPA: ferritin [Anaeromyxobacter sp.]|nr:ferritin [Anaeromyxobacter sp.]